MMNYVTNLVIERVMFNAVWDPAGVWTQENAEKLLQNAQEYWAEVNNAVKDKPDSCRAPTSLRTRLGRKPMQVEEL